MNPKNKDFRSQLSSFLQDKQNSYIRSLIISKDPHEISLLQGKIQALQMVEDEMKNIKVTVHLD
jgi:hypothetical protein